MHILNSNLKSTPTLVSGSGPFLFSENGEKFFDCWLGSGTLIFGHEKLSSSMYETNFLLPEGNYFNQEFENLVGKTVDFEIGAVGFQTSGSGAIHRACRLARAVTKKDKIAIISKFWHGSDDAFLFEGNKSRILSDGIPIESQSNSIFFQDLKEFFDKADFSEIAGILVEPNQGADPSLDILSELDSNKRKILVDNRVLLIADEVITGFRTRFGSTTSSRNAKPDIVVFGKAIGGGFPIGIVLVTKELAALLKEQAIFWGGTFSASPFQIKMMQLNLKRLLALDFRILEKNLNELIVRITEILNGTQFKVAKGGGFGRIILEKQDDKQSSARGFLENGKSLMQTARNIVEKEKIYINTNLLIFPSIYNINQV